jgi:hypothetical protein
VARAVDWVHRKNIVHRDLKPANVLLAADGTPKIADFGLARMLDGGTALTGTGSVLGTPEYMSPEQASGKNKDIGPAADVWALGVLLYELLTGRTPFRADAMLDTLAAVLFDETLPPSRRFGEVPKALDWVCLKCLEKRPEQRYASAADLADDLDRFVAGEPVRAHPRSRRIAFPWVRGKLKCPSAVSAALAQVATRCAAGARAVGRHKEVVTGVILLSQVLNLGLSFTAGGMSAFLVACVAALGLALTLGLLFTEAQPPSENNTQCRSVPNRGDRLC